MKTKITVGLGLASALIIGAAAAASTATDKTGSVRMYLMNPEGRVDGLLLADGTQVHFPPHLSQKLTDLVKAKDDVTVTGSKEAEMVMRADKITNTKTGKSITDTPPTDADGGPKPPPPLPGGPHAGPPPAGPHGGPGARENLKEMTSSGTITDQLNGRRGEVNGVILQDSTIVHFGPKLVDDSKVKLAKGQKIKVTGFGTKNDFGQSIEATEVEQGN